MTKRRRPNNGRSAKCPYCGVALDSWERGCKRCGSDEDLATEADDQLEERADAPTGYAGEDDFDYDEYVESEFPEHASSSAARSLKRVLWAVIVVMIVVATIAMTVQGY